MSLLSCLILVVNKVWLEWNFTNMENDINWILEKKNPKLVLALLGQLVASCGEEIN